METASEGFIPPAVTSSSKEEIVKLTESGETLELLFQYMYPQRRPEIKKIGFKQLEALAEAAEKYQVFSAMDVCQWRLACVVMKSQRITWPQEYYREIYAKHPLEVLCFAMKHGYSDLATLTEKKALELSPTVAFERLPLPAYIAWVSVRVSSCPLNG